MVSLCMCIGEFESAVVESHQTWTPQDHWNPNKLKGHGVA